MNWLKKNPIENEKGLSKNAAYCKCFKGHKYKNYIHIHIHTHASTLFDSFVCLHAYTTKQLFSMVIQNSNNKEYQKMLAREKKREPERLT